MIYSCLVDVLELPHSVVSALACFIVVRMVMVPSDRYIAVLFVLAALAHKLFFCLFTHFCGVFVICFYCTELYTHSKNLLNGDLSSTGLPAED